jgi:MoxR-like ATPase
MPQDVVDVVPDVMRHRLVLSYEALSDAVTGDAILHRILEHLPAPAAPLQAHVSVSAQS